MTRLLFYAATAAAVLIGCVEATHDFQIRFNEVLGLKKGDRIFFEENEIGQVNAVKYTDSGKYLVSVSIEEPFASTATDTSKFYIDSSPESEAQKIIRVVQTDGGGRKIAENAVVEGHTKRAVLFDRFVDQFRKNMALFESELDAFLQKLKDLSDDEQIRAIEKRLNEIIADLGDMSIAMKNKLETEILPFLKRQIEELRRRLENTGEEEKLESVDEKIEVISNRLRA